MLWGEFALRFAHDDDSGGRVVERVEIGESGDSGWVAGVNGSGAGPGIASAGQDEVGGLIMKRDEA